MSAVSQQATAPVMTVASAEVQVSAPTPQTGTVTGTVTDTDGAAIPGATVVLQGPTPEDRRAIKSDESGFFQVTGVQPAVPYSATVSEDGFSVWTSTVQLQPGQYLDLKQIPLKVSTVVTAVTAETTEQLAVEQVHAEEHQRVLGVIPNFYVSYSPDPQPLSTKLKFKLALRTSTDVVTLVSSAFVAGIYQASDTPGYVQGAKGYGQRYGAAYAGTASDVMIGGAILPSLLHQDPRYFYKGTGTKKERALHAIESPFIARGDNGKAEFNYSSIGGDVLSGALENVYYPPVDRGAHLVVNGTLIDTGGRMLSALAQEFLLSKVTSHGQK
ncbi:carboxypeptidase-like regulatory domain-containing protein [Granulicella sp. 5B5]|uniref:carboxypeptidase-like regulatory domain-containing protein n=1 Tax=Granulicella sp. 5B5 TaxID=1617967 RepID=UPI0021026EE9|nr:carboxypeptidase-like regulatory domain-containing protein [Granulicella sp. 5B5]